MTLAHELTEHLQNKGADIVAFADLNEIPSEQRQHLPIGISIAIALNPEIVAEIQENPTLEYYEEYKRVNVHLERLGQAAEEFLTDRGYTAKNSAPTNDHNLTTSRSPLPHKTVATRASLGWIGKCALLVTEKFGSAIRLTAVLTNAELPTATAVNESRCNTCSICVNACPGQAASGASWNVGKHRDEFFDAAVCRRAARAQAAKINVQNTICGRCIAVCPWTQKYLKNALSRDYQK